MKNEQGKIGRPTISDHLRREPCHGIRLPAIWLYWLKGQSQSGGKLIQQALDSHFGPEIDMETLVKKFYGRN